ncbi:PIN domain-containing protein [Candidatus Woesearchaeota archaeon]|nr:PIN domain-containing protein [Candidatus Woesearchaeota archaeon]
MTLFCDTYALIELFKGNPKFLQFRGERFVISVLNLLEFYYNALGEKGEAAAKEWYWHLKEDVAEVDDESLFEAMDFRMLNKKLNLSYADALGYCMARRMHIPFVTGDEAFRHLENVVFLKK